MESDCVRERCQLGDGSRLRCDILGENQLSMWGSPLVLQPSPVKLLTFTGEVIIPKGEAEVKVEYAGQTCRLPLLVT